MTAQPAHALRSQVALSGVPEESARGLKILFALKTFDPGGAEKVALRLAENLAARGAEVRVAVGHDEGALRHELRALPYFAVAGRRPPRVPVLTLMHRLPALVAALQPDVVVCPGNAYSQIGVILKLRLGRRAPKLVLKISNDLARRDLPLPTRLLNRLWLRFQAPFYDSIIAIAPPAAEEARTVMGVAPEKLTTINNPALLDADRLRLAELRDSTLRARPGRHYLAIGRLVAQKNFALLIDSFADVAGPDDRLTILGEGPERAALEALVVRRGVEAQIAMPGHTPDIAPHLAVADAYVLSSDYEGLAAVLIEALAAGVPVVATNCSVNMEWLLGGVGTLVPVGDRAALGEAMRTSADPAPAKVALLRARAADFTVDASAGRWLAHLAALAGRTARQVAA